MTAPPVVDNSLTVAEAKQVYVYQITNFDSEEMIFGTTDLPLEKEVERIAKDPAGPAKGWKQGQVVQWRPLTDLLPPARASALHLEIESKTPPNKYRVLRTHPKHT